MGPQYNSALASTFLPEAPFAELNALRLTKAKCMKQICKLRKASKSVNRRITWSNFATGCGWLFPASFPPQRVGFHYKSSVNVDYAIGFVFSNGSRKHTSFLELSTKSD